MLLRGRGREGGEEEIATNKIIVGPTIILLVVPRLGGTRPGGAKGGGEIATNKMFGGPSEDFISRPPPGGYQT